MKGPNLATWESEMNEIQKSVQNIHVNHQDSDPKCNITIFATSLRQVLQPLHHGGFCQSEESFMPITKKCNHNV